MPGGGLGAEHAHAPFRHVQIQFQYPLLAHDVFDHVGQDQFLALADIAARTRQEQVLGQLLGDGGAAAHLAAPGFLLLLVVFPGLADGVPFDAVVLGEI